MRKSAYQRGLPGAIPLTALETEVGVRLFGSRKRTAASDQNPLHTTRGVIIPPMPRAAAEDAMPAACPPPPSGSGLAARRPATRGQAIRPMQAYRSTDPGAPVSAVAEPVKTKPSPSPNTQTPRT